MAEADLVVSNLRSLIQKELTLYLGFGQDFQTLSCLITTIKATLEDAEEKKIIVKRKLRFPARIWI